MNKEEQIILSWHSNAANWIDVIASEGIESRTLVTNKAIVDAVCSVSPASVFDIGCGEGWLAKELYNKGIDITGVDVIPELINKAKDKLPGDFYVASYEDIASNRITFSKLFDAIVINFALIGKESTEKLLASLSGYLHAHGSLFIQTLHPYSRKAIDDYTTGWKEGSWDGLGEQFTQPYQWYFRTMEDWLALLTQSGFTKIKITETVHPETNKPVSVIFTACSTIATESSRPDSYRV